MSACSCPVWLILVRAFIEGCCLPRVVSSSQQFGKSVTNIHAASYNCSAGLKWTAIWTVGLTVVSSVAVFSLQSFARVRVLVGLLYIGLGVVAAPVALLVGGMCCDSCGILGRKNDLRCYFAFWCCALFPVLLILSGCLLCFQINQVLVYMSPALSPLLLAFGDVIIDFTVDDTAYSEHISHVTDPLGVPLV